MFPGMSAGRKNRTPCSYSRSITAQLTAISDSPPTRIRPLPMMVRIESFQSEVLFGWAPSWAARSPRTIAGPAGIWPASSTSLTSTFAPLSFSMA